MGAIINLIKPFFGILSKVGMQAITSKTSPLLKTVVILALSSNIISKDAAEFAMVYLNKTPTSEIITSIAIVYVALYVHGPLWASRDALINKIKGKKGENNNE